MGLNLNSGSTSVPARGVLRHSTTRALTGGVPSAIRIDGQIEVPSAIRLDGQQFVLMDKPSGSYQVRRVCVRAVRFAARRRAPLPVPQQVIHCHLSQQRIHFCFETFFSRPLSRWAALFSRKAKGTHQTMADTFQPRRADAEKCGRFPKSEKF